LNLREEEEEGGGGGGGMGGGGGGGGGLVQIGGRSMFFYAGKKRDHINLCTRIREGVSKKCALQRGGSGEFEHDLPPFAPAFLPLNNDLSLSAIILRGNQKRFSTE